MYLSYRSFAFIHYIIIVAVIIATKKIVNSYDYNGFYMEEFNPSYPAICDREYRIKYFNNEAHRTAVAAGKLFAPPTFNPNVVNRSPNNRIPGAHDNRYLENSQSSKDDYASQFLSIDLNSGPQSLVYGDKERTKFTDKKDSSKKKKYNVRNLSRSSFKNLTNLQKFIANDKNNLSPRFDETSIREEKTKSRLKHIEPPKHSNDFMKFNDKERKHRKNLWSRKSIKQKRLFPKEIKSRSDDNRRKKLLKLSGLSVKNFNEFDRFGKNGFNDDRRRRIISSVDRFYSRLLPQYSKNRNESHEFKKILARGNKFPKFTKEINFENKSGRRDMRENQIKIEEKDEPIGFYKSEDTFGPLKGARRAEKPGVRTANATIDSANQDQCKSMRRIVNGYAVQSLERLPYMAFVDTGCGGSIISELWVLTAGHCLDMDSPTYVHVGSVTLMAGCQYNIVHVYIHPQYSRKNLEFDVGLLKVDPPFVFSPAIKPIKMSSVRALRKMCGIVAGWGAAEFNGPPRISLLMTTIPIVARRKCRKFGIRKSQFCAGYDDGYSDACQGDSGGAFVVDNVVVGIVSYGYKCSLPHKPGVYVDVSYVREWIRSITGL